MSRQRVDVVGLLKYLGIKARRRGSEWWASCPLHGETEPSWQIHDNPDDDLHGLWRCFGCGAKGNAAGLVGEMLRLEWKDAQAILEANGLLGGPPPLPMRIEVASSERRVGCVLPTGVEFPPLDRWVSPARRYLLGRGVTAEQIERWRIGYAVDGKLRGRIVFPVRDIKRQLIGYSARTFIDDDKRYLEPSVADGYEVGAVFGEEYWPAPASRQMVIVTEGAINGLAVERAADACAEFIVPPPFGAVRGSNLMPGHVARLSTFGTVLVASDPDPAGDKLFLALSAALGRWSRIVRVKLPTGSDCAEVPVEMLSEAIGWAANGDQLQ